MCFGTTPTVSQKTAKACTVGGTTCASASITSTTGHAMAVQCQFATTSATLSVSDGTNTYTAVGSANTSATAPGSMRWFVAKNITGVSHVITCSSTVSVGFAWIAVYEIAGASTTAPVDVPTSAQASGTTGTSATPSFTLPTTTFANDLLLFAATCGNTCAADVSATNAQSDANGDESETYAKSATGTYTGTFTQTSGTFGVVGVAITDGGGGGSPTCSQSISLMGVGCQ